MYFSPIDIANNVLANPTLSKYLLPTNTIPIKTAENTVETIANTLAYHEHPIATIQLHHIASKKQGKIIVMMLFNIF
jgi:hypothetical protein